MTRHQIDHNLAVVEAIRELRTDLVIYQHRMSEIIASLEASLRSEILGADTREDRHEREIIRLAATTAALRVQLEELSSSINDMVSEPISETTSRVETVNDISNDSHVVTRLR